MKITTPAIVLCFAACANTQPLGQSECSSLDDDTALQKRHEPFQRRGDILRDKLCNEDRDCKGKCVCGLIWPDRGTGLCVSKRDKAMLEAIQREGAAGYKGPVWPSGGNSAGYYGQQPPGFEPKMPGELDDLRLAPPPPGNVWESGPVQYAGPAPVVVAPPPVPHLLIHGTAPAFNAPLPAPPQSVAHSSITNIDADDRAELEKQLAGTLSAALHSYFEKEGDSLEVNTEEETKGEDNKWSEKTCTSTKIKSKTTTDKKGGKEPEEKGKKGDKDDENDRRDGCGCKSGDEDVEWHEKEDATVGKNVEAGKEEDEKDAEQKEWGSTA